MKQKTLFIIGSVWIEPGSSAAGSRMLQLIRAFQSHGYKIIFGTDASPSGFAFDLCSIEVDTMSIEVNSSSFNDLMMSLNPDIVLYDRFISEEKFGWRVAEACPDAVQILDTEDLHCLRAARNEALARNGKDFHPYLFNDISKREIASIYRCDVTLIISRYEMEILHNVFRVPPALLHYCPFMMDPINEQAQKKWNSFKEKKGFVTIGNFHHKPNSDALTYLKSTIWPMIRKGFPKAEVYNYGAYPNEKINALHDPSNGFYIMGRAENAFDVMNNARVCLAPLRFGAGLKGKLIDAMFAGTPSITTSIGAESMHFGYPWPGSIQDDPEKFAEHAIRYYHDESLLVSSRETGISIINEIFPYSFHSDNLIKVITQLAENITDHRISNFTGLMLRHHAHSSTKYFSRWLELKNKIH